MSPKILVLSGPQLRYFGAYYSYVRNVYYDGGGGSWSRESDEHFTNPHIYTEIVAIFMGFLG